MAKMKILLISGHGAGDPGASGNGYKEAEETIRIVKKLETKLDKYCDVLHYPYDRNAFKDIENGKFAVSLKGVDYVFEVHLNSFKDSSANGTEIWVTSMEKTIGVEKKIMSKLEKYFKVRGVKRTNFLVIRYCKNKGVSSALIETCFISNKKDMDTYEKNFDGVVQGMCDGIVEGFGLKKSSKPKPVKPSKPSKPSKPTTEYYKKCSANKLSLVDGLKEIGVDSSFAHRKKIAKANKILMYRGTTTQNVKLLNLLKAGRLKKV